MLKKTAIAFCAIVLLSACSHKVKRDDTNANYLVSEFEREVGDKVYFAYDSHALSPMSKEVLGRQADWLMKHPSFNATVEGHCDERGTREYNIALGEKRADAVVKFLSMKGVEANRLDMVSYGKERPVALGNTESDWQQNRRGVTVLK